MSETREPSARLVRPLRSGQITIPAEFRRRLGITESTMLRMTLTGGELRLQPVRAVPTGEGSPWLHDLYERFAPVREEARSSTEDEIDVAIQAAVDATRRAHA